MAYLGDIAGRRSLLSAIIVSCLSHCRLLRLPRSKTSAENETHLIHFTRISITSISIPESKWGAWCNQGGKVFLPLLGRVFNLLSRGANLISAKAYRAERGGNTPCQVGDPGSCLCRPTSSGSAGHEDIELELCVHQSERGTSRTAKYTDK